MPSGSRPTGTYTHIVYAYRAHTLKINENIQVYHSAFRIEANRHIHTHVVYTTTNIHTHILYKYAPIYVYHSAFRIEANSHIHTHIVFVDTKISTDAYVL